MTVISTCSSNSHSYDTPLLLEYPILATATGHKKRHMAISREPDVVSYIRWCQNDQKILNKKEKKKVENIPKWSRMVKMVQNNPEWSKMVQKSGQHGEKWPNWSKWSKMVKNGPKWSKMVKMVKNGQKWSKMAGLTLSGPNVPA